MQDAAGCGGDRTSVRPTGGYDTDYHSENGWAIRLELK